MIPLFHDLGDETVLVFGGGPVGARKARRFAREASVVVDDPTVNEAVEAAARERGALVNRADQSGGRDAGSVVVPATVRDGGVTVAISTGGASPAVARELRKRIETEIEGAGELAAATAELRAELKARGVDPERRREALRAAVQSPSVWKDLGTGGSKPRRTIDVVVESTLGETE
ncbi:siroheme synthase [Halobacteriales archaeon QH_10_70_21]|nr:MAG: siroheme synthase [Halobacteriales archaeon QH_10_70_21]